MRRLVVLTLLAACGKPAASSGPAWPKSAGWEPVGDWKKDGGESIEPRHDDVAAIESSDDPVPAGNAEVTVEVTPEPPPADAPTPPPGDAQPPPEFVPEETIIIEGELPPDPPPDPPPPP